MQENNLLIRQILGLIQPSRLKQKTQTKRMYIVENSDYSETDKSPYESDYHEEKNKFLKKK